MCVLLRSSFGKLLNVFGRYGKCVICRHLSGSCSGCHRRLSIAGASVSFQKHQWRCFGQPASQTHPHLLSEGQVTPGITVEEYRLRRHRLMELIGRRTTGHRSSGVVVVVPSAPKAYMTHDIPYPFRQNTDFFYLCGFLEPDSVLLLEADTVSRLPEHRATLFVPRRDVHRELWDGPRSGTDGAVLLTGVDAAYNSDDLGPYLDRLAKDHSRSSLWYDSAKPAHPAFHQQYFSEFVSRGAKKVTDPLRPLVQALRIIKSTAELDLMKQTCMIASEAFRQVMLYSTPGVNESHLYAKMDFECRIRGAEYLAYPPVVAGGERANIIHYIANNQIIDDGEMLLMDAGCEYHGYTSDITRSWPVSGRFNAHQRELYEALLEVQQECINLCYPGVMTMNEIYGEMLMMLGVQLQKLNILSKDISRSQLQAAAREFCPHHVSHYLGIDVHDTDEIPRSVKLTPGMVITIEPGIYIPKSRLDVRAELCGIGLRIEDDILITSDGPYNLCSRCPKHPNDIESLMNN